MRTQFSKLALAATFGLALAFTFSCSSDDDGDDVSSSSVTGGGSSSSKTQNSSSPSVEYTGGSCDMKDYRTVLIGEQVWMAENFGCYVLGSKCNNNDPTNCTQYGRLYDWSTAMALPSSCNSSSCSSQISVKHRGICPIGWHIPSDADWGALIAAVGGASTAGVKLKAKNGWVSNGNGTDDFEFSALPGGYGYSDGRFFSVGNTGFWWSSSELDASHAYYRLIDYLSGSVIRVTHDKADLYSVRCVQD